jgi:hypothetical protein
MIIRLGFDQSSKFVIVGDDTIFMSPYAVNRNLILSMNKPLKTHRYKALGIQDIKNVI